MSHRDCMSLGKDLFGPRVVAAMLDITSHKWTRGHPDTTLVFPWYLHLASPFSFSSLVTYCNIVQGNLSRSVSNLLRLLIVRHKCNPGLLPFRFPFLDRNVPLTVRVFFLPSFPRPFLKRSLLPLGVGMQWPPALVKRPTLCNAPLPLLTRPP